MPWRWVTRFALTVHLLLTSVLLEEYALTGAGYTVVRLLQSFPTLRLPYGERLELVGVEKQRTTLVLSVGEGCKVEIGSS